MFVKLNLMWVGLRSENRVSLACIDWEPWVSFLSSHGILSIIDPRLIMQNFVNKVTQYLGRHLNPF